MSKSDFSNTNKKPALILVIDDDDHISNMLRIYFGAHGYEVVTASSSDGKTGLERALRLQPDVVLLDPLEPGVDGFDVLAEVEREIRAQHLPLIILRPWNVRDNIINELSTEGDYITKPFDIEELKLRIKSLIRRK